MLLPLIKELRKTKPTLVKCICCNNAGENHLLEDVLKKEKPFQDDVGDSKQRKMSLYIAHASLFIVSMGFSTVLTGVYPYMKQLLPTTVEENKDDEVGIFFSSL